MSLDCQEAFNQELAELKKLNANLETLIKLITSDKGVIYQLALNAEISEAVLKILGGGRL